MCAGIGVHRLRSAALLADRFDGDGATITMENPDVRDPLPAFITMSGLVAFAHEAGFADYFFSPPRTYQTRHDDESVDLIMFAWSRDFGSCTHKQSH